MKQPNPFGADARQGAAQSPFPVPPPPRDPFKVQQERRAAKAAGKPLAKEPKPPKPPKPVKASKAPVAAPAAADYYNPFGPAQAGPATVKPVSSRTLANGAELQLVSSQPQAKPAPPVEAAKEERRQIYAGATTGAAALAMTVATAPPPPPAPPQAPSAPPVSPSASAPATRSAATAGAGAANDSSYWGDAGASKPGKSEKLAAASASRTNRIVRRSGGGGEERAFNQDDIAGLIIALALLLLLGWIWLQNQGKGADDSVPHPLMAATEPAKPDPFGRGPVDLRPTSPMPQAAPAPAPAPVETKAPEPTVTPQSAPPAAAAPVLATPAPSPPTQKAAAIAAAPAAGAPLHVYFCTARTSMTASAKKAFEQELKSWKTSVAGNELVVTGYADTRGTTEANAELATLRADYLADMLRAEGLTVTEAVGVGELPGMADGQNCANQRRADISFKSEPAHTPSKACAPPPEDEALVCAS